MAKRFDLLVFDWDGTILDSADAIVEAIGCACRDLGLPQPTPETARYVIGLGLRDALRRVAPVLAETDYPQLAERYRHHYLARDHELKVFAGMTELVHELVATGFLLAVATGKSRLGLQRALRHSGLDRHFHATRCADECSAKPHPQMLLELMAELSVAPERTLMIGDTTHDLLMARNAGVHGIAVAYGAHQADALDALQPRARLNCVTELAEWLHTNA